MIFTPAALAKCRRLITTSRVIYRYYRRPDSISLADNDQQLSRRVSSLSLIARHITALANTHPKVDFGWWALDTIDYAASLASRSRRRTLKWRVFHMELCFLVLCRAWGVFRVRRDIRYRLRKRFENWLSNRLNEATFGM